MKKFSLIIFICLLIIGALLLYVYIDSRRPKQFEINFLDIGQGDSALIKFANGQKMLVDCGASKIVLSALSRHLAFYDRTIDYVLATHPDLDHYGGCVDVLQRYDVKTIIVNGREKKYDPYWQEWHKTMLAEPGATIVTMASPTTWTIASDTLQFMSPDSAFKLNVAAADSNNYSIVFKLTHDKETFLFTGDMEVPLENALMEKYCVTSTSETSPPVLPFAKGRKNRDPLLRKGEGRERSNSFTCPTLRTDVLKVGHHGSDTGSSEKFLSVVKPQTAVISVGKNKYGHPTLRVLKHLERTGATVLRTDQLGDIVQK